MRARGGNVAPAGRSSNAGATEGSIICRSDVFQPNAKTKPPHGRIERETHMEPARGQSSSGCSVVGDVFHSGARFISQRELAAARVQRQVEEIKSDAVTVSRGEGRR